MKVNNDSSLTVAVVPVRIQRSRTSKQVSPNGLPIVYVGRPSKWGNPFKVVGEEGNWFIVNEENEPLVSFYDKKDAIDCCIENYKEYISHEHNLQIVNVFDLKGKNLSCWCKLDCKCHVDVLLKLANE
jgi:hypothetical protein